MSGGGPMEIFGNFSNLRSEPCRPSLEIDPCCIPPHLHMCFTMSLLLNKKWVLQMAKRNIHKDIVFQRNFYDHAGWFEKTRKVLKVILFSRSFVFGF